MENPSTPPVRSISLPSRIHPTSVKLESFLSNIKKVQTPTVDSTETIHNGVLLLAELYSCVEEFIHTPATQQVLLRHRNGGLMEEALKGSVTLLDTCCVARDVMLTMKQHVRTLQSTLRRRGGDSSNVESEINSYISFKKKMKKDISKCLGNLKKTETKIFSRFSLMDISDQQPSFIIKVLQETTAATISVLKSVLLFVSVPTGKSSKIGGFSLISKLVPMRSSSPSDEKRERRMINEVESVEHALYSVLGKHSKKGGSVKDDVEVAKRELEKLNVSIDGFESGLENMYRCLVENRVSLLNILTN